MNELKQAAIKISDALHNLEKSGVEIPEYLDDAWFELSMAIQYNMETTPADTIEVQRFEPAWGWSFPAPDGIEVKMVEHSEGAWVAYEDYIRGATKPFNPKVLDALQAKIDYWQSQYNHADEPHEEDVTYAMLSAFEEALNIITKEQK